MYVCMYIKKRHRAEYDICRRVHDMTDDASKVGRKEGKEIERKVKI